MPANQTTSQDEAIAHLRRTLTEKILMNADDIIEAAIAQAKQGHYSITRLLFAIAGLYPAPRSLSDTTDHSLADFLCKQLGLPELASENNSPQAAPPAERADSLK